jgi:hypothetical protein
MTPSPTTSAMSDEDFEAEVRAMLTRRAADVSPSAAPRRRPVVRAADQTERPPLVIPLSRSRLSRTPTRRPTAVAIAAAVVLVTALVGLVTSARDDDSFETGVSTTVPGQTPVIWPLGGAVPTDLLAAPETTVRAYLAEVAQVPAETPLGDTTTEGDRATVDYVLQGVGAQVSLRSSDGGWRVTQATNDAVDIIRARLDGDAVDVGIAPGPRGWSPMTLRATAIDNEGETVG